MNCTFDVNFVFILLGGVLIKCSFMVIGCVPRLVYAFFYVFFGRFLRGFEGLGVLRLEGG